jgi:leader peptidase (prepilin peptidase)/N-methyltransferase
LTAFVAIVAGAFGLAVGSFINVVAYRIPRGESVVAPRSACPLCGHPISSRDNIPVLSWLLLRGRCRNCGEPISVRYPIVEGGTALAFAGTVVVIGVGWRLPAYLFFAAVTITLTLTDLDHKRIPNRILYPSIPVALGLLAVAALGEGEWGNLGRAFGGGLAYFGVWAAVAVITRGGFGMGDVKLSFFLGLYLAYLSWRALVVGAFLAVLIGGVVSLALLVTRRKGRRDQVPFGPSLVAGAWLAVIWGGEITRWYLGG